MKARIVNQKPEIALLYNFDSNDEFDSPLIETFINMGIKFYPVSSTHLSKTVSELAWGEHSTPMYGKGDQVIILGGFTDQRLNSILAALKAAGGGNVPKSIVTPYNKDWPLDKLIPEILVEHSRLKK